MPRSALVRLSRLLGEPVMGLLALVAVFLALAPAAFAVPAPVEHALDVVEWSILGVFALEYLVDLALSPDRRAYVTSGSRLLDLVILTTPLVSLVVPSEALRASPILRLVRFARVLVFGARVHGRFRGEDAAAAAAPPATPRVVRVLHPEGAPQDATWEAALTGLSDLRDEWIEASGLGPNDFRDVAGRVGVPAALIEGMLAETAYPRVEVFAQATVMFLWLPSLVGEAGERLERRGVVLAVSDRTLLTASRAPITLQADVTADLAVAGTLAPAVPFGARALFGVLHRVLRGYEAVSGGLERQLRALEATPLRESRPEFLERTFRLQQQLSQCKSDLWRLKGILGVVADGRLTLHGVPPACVELARDLVDDAGYAYETVFNAREGLMSLVDLHLNVVSFEMNRVMRVLAVVSVLGLVPALIGGMLGMNVSGSPWPLTLSQVAYVTSAVMSTFLYVFVVKGWLR